MVTKISTLNEHISIKELCKKGYCLSKNIREERPQRNYVCYLTCAIQEINENNLRLAFFILVDCLESIEKDEGVYIPHMPSSREKADRYYKLIKGKAPETEPSHKDSPGA